MVDPKVREVGGSRGSTARSGDGGGAPRRGADRGREPRGGCGDLGVARRHDLRPQQLFAWRHQVGRAHRLPAEELSFVPVVAAAADAPLTRPRLPGSSRLQLGGVVVRGPARGRWQYGQVLRDVKAVA